MMDRDKVVDLGAGVVFEGGTLDDLLTPEERAALDEHLAYLAKLRRRVEAESRGIVMP